MIIKLIAEGNVGTGKSLLLKHIKEYLEKNTILEISDIKEESNYGRPAHNMLIKGNNIPEEFIK